MPCVGSNPRFDFRATEDSTCFRPLGYRDRLKNFTYGVNYTLHQSAQQGYHQSLILPVKGKISSLSLSMAVQAFEP
jgi:hypothetical protein